ncbi:hypothetical protein JOC85_001857 [Bacillus mesophilus]|nr:hypothetical protein [Bacillus mesophilus]
MIFVILSCLSAIVILYAIISYGVSNGIDSSKKMKQLESDLTVIKNKLSELEK